MIIQSINSRVFLFSIVLFISSLHSQSDVSIASKSSIIPFQLSPTSITMIHLGGIQVQDDVRLMTGLQLQPTNNLLIGGVLSPHKLDTDLSIYYHLVIGYIPKWKFFNLSSNMFQIGMHRNRFGADTDTRWFSFSIMESAQFSSFNLNLCWNRLFNQDWDRNTAMISTDLNLSNGIYLRPGIMANFTSNIEYIPFLFVSMAL